MKRLSSERLERINSINEMAPSAHRRHTSVTYAKKLLFAISAIKQQRLIPDFKRISKYLQRYTDIDARTCKEHLNNAVSDGLIVEYSAVGPQRNDAEQEGYRIPDQGEIEEVDDGHDWYCFECHMPGDVYECNKCFRVYHQGCTREDTTGQTFTCSVCRASQKSTKMKRKMLNTLLSYTILRLKSKAKELMRLSDKAPPDDFHRFIYRKMDLRKMEQKVQSFRYRCLEEFHADARTILHNCTLLFGTESGGYTDLAVMMVKDSRYDLDEILLCPNCYYMSNSKPEFWFSQPCNPPHDIVYAKQKGYCYWPAKIVRDLGVKFDVRFFGSYHQRAIIPAEFIKPISSDTKKLNMKKTGALAKSMKELKKYQEILKEREQEMEEMIDKFQEAEAQEEESEGNQEEELSETEEDQTFSDAGEPNQVCDAKKEEEEEEEFRDAKEEKPQIDKDGKEEIPVVDEEKEATSDEEDVKSYVKEEIEVPENVTPKRSLPHKTKSTRQSLKRNDGSSSRNRRMSSKRKLEELNKSIQQAFDDDEEVNNGQVSSTSFEKEGRSKRKKISKNNHDESYQVSSSMDKVLNIPRVSTQSVGTQTTQKMEMTQSAQTDLTEIMETKRDDADWEDKLARSMNDLTQRLEEKFEETKQRDMNELAKQLEEDFGKDKQLAVERAHARIREQYMEEMKNLARKHKEHISETKRKQWCLNCEMESMYHCCWNTSYCSIACQKQHWDKEHKKVCRRKRSQDEHVSQKNKKPDKQ